MFCNHEEATQLTLVAFLWGCQCSPGASAESLAHKPHKHLPRHPQFQRELPISHLRTGSFLSGASGKRARVGRQAEQDSPPWPGWRIWCEIFSWHQQLISAIHFERHSSTMEDLREEESQRFLRCYIGPLKRRVCPEELLVPTSSDATSLTP